MYGNLFHIQYRDGRFRFGQELVNGAFIISIGPEEIGFLDSFFEEFGGNHEPNSWAWINSDKDSWSFGGAAYFIAGGSFTAGFRLNYFLEQMNRIIRDRQ